MIYFLLKNFKIILSSLVDLPTNVSQKIYIALEIKKINKLLVWYHSNNDK